MPPLGGLQFTTNSAYGQAAYFVNLAGLSASIRFDDLVELELGYQLGIPRCSDLSLASQRLTGRLGLAPRVGSVRIPVLMGVSDTIFKSHCDEGASGYAFGGMIATGVDWSTGIFDVRFLVNGGYQAGYLEGYFGDVTEPESLTVGASLELGVTFDLGRQTNRGSN